MSNWRVASKGRGRFVIRAFVDLMSVTAPLKRLGSPVRGSGKNILIFNWRDTRHEYAGGAEVYVHELAKRWVDNGNHVTLFCGQDGKGTIREEVIDGVEIIRRGGFWFVYVWAFVYYMFRFRRQYDVIVDCHNGIPFFTPLFAREPVICVVHHVHQEVFRKFLKAPLARFAMWLEAVLVPRVYNHSQFVAVSPSTKSEMTELGMNTTERDIEIIYNGVDLGELRPGHKSPEPMVLFLGRLQTYKSIDVLIKAFQKILIAVPRAQLVIAGGGDAADELHALTRQLGLADAVIFAGRVSNEEKIRLLQSAWVSVNPSMMEGWGITTIEANACATPVVGADVPGLRDSIRDGETGYLVPHGDVDGFARRIIDLLETPVMRQAVGSRAHSWAQEFRWDTSAHRMLGLMEVREQGERYSTVEGFQTIE